MPKKMFLGVDNVSRRSKKAYIGIDGVARKIKKMYIGVDNIARCMFSTGRPFTVTATSSSFMKSGAYASIGDMTLSAGGFADSGYGGNKIYSTEAIGNTTGNRPSNLASGVGIMTAGATGNHFVFAGGGYCFYSSSASSTSTPYHWITYQGVDAYDTSLTKITAANLHAKKLFTGYTKGHSASIIGQRVLFAGGMITTPNTEYSSRLPAGTYTNVVESYDNNLTKHTPAALSGTRAGTSGGTYACSSTHHAFFAGYNYNSSYSGVFLDAYDNSLTKTALSPSANPVTKMAKYKDYMIFPVSAMLCAYDSSLTFLQLADITGKKVGDVGIEVDNYLFYPCYKACLYLDSNFCSCYEEDENIRTADSICKTGNTIYTASSRDAVFGRVIQYTP